LKIENRSAQQSALSIQPYSIRVRVQVRVKHGESFDLIRQSSIINLKFSPLTARVAGAYLFSVLGSRVLNAGSGLGSG
jgi:hypothetical protein